MYKYEKTQYFTSIKRSIGGGERITRVSYWLIKRRPGQDGLNPFGTS